MGRFVAIALVNLRVELAYFQRSGEPPSHQADRRKEVSAVVIARPGSAVKDETSLLGNTRLDEVSHEAFRLGIRAGRHGDTVASARARSAELRVRVVPLESVEKTLAGLAEMALAFGPTTAFKVGGKAGDVVWVDVTGCAHLHGGELPLVSKLVEKVQAMGHTCRAAVADGPRVAAAVARFAEEGSRQAAKPPGKEKVLASSRLGGPSFVVPAGESASALADLPLAALGLEEKTFAWMSALGLRRVTDLQRLPRASLGTRLEGDAARVLALLEGDDRAPLVAYVPPEVPTEEAELEYGIESAEALLFVVKRLAGRLAARLEGRVQKATRLELVLGLDLGTSKSAVASRERLEVVLASPLAREGELFAVLKTRIEAEDRIARSSLPPRAPFRAPILNVTLRATSVVTARAEALDLYVPEAKAARGLPKLASELMAELGPERVGTLALANTWVPEARSRLLPYGAHARKRESELAWLSDGIEPTRLFPKPKIVKRASLTHSRLLARFEAVEWWRQGHMRLGASNPRSPRVEHYASWSEDLRAMAWVELDEKEAKVKGAFD
jgi:protein ImuB